MPKKITKRAVVISGNIRTSKKARARRAARTRKEQTAQRAIKRAAAQLKLKAMKKRRTVLHAAASLLKDFHGGKPNKRTGRIETGCGRPRRDGSSRSVVGERGEWRYVPARGLAGYDEE